MIWRCCHTFNSKFFVEQLTMSFIRNNIVVKMTIDFKKKHFVASGMTGSVAVFKL